MTAMYGAISTAIGAIWIVLALVAGAFLLRAYVRTRMSGWIWLLVAIVVWPAISRVLFALLPMIAVSHALPYVSASGGESVMTLTLGLSAITSLIGAVLLIVACVVLGNQVMKQAAAYPSPAFSYAPYGSSQPVGTAPVYPRASGDPRI